MENSTDEVWRPIPGFEGQYEVSSHGNVRSLDRILMKPNKYGGVSPRRFRGRPRKAWMTRTGYWQVRLVDKEPARMIHQLVLEAFIGPRPSPDSVTRHLNGIRTDNRAENLAWGTQLENMRDRYTHGTDNLSVWTHCSRGHRLAGKNLDPAAGRRGKRLCWSCEHAKSKVRWQAGKGVQLDMQAVADEFYATVRDEIEAA